MNIMGKIEKWVIYAIYGVLILTLLNTCNSCNAKRENTKLKKEVIILQNKIDSVYSKRELDIRMEINGLKVSKRTLYDWNSIVRTVVRPDDRMNEYDKEILKLERELDRLKNKNNE